MFTGSNPLVVFAKASMLMNCKIQTLCVKTNIRVSFTPPEVMDEDCVKMLYYHRQNFTMCQRILEIGKNFENQDSSTQMEPDFSKVCIQRLHWQLFRDYYVAYVYNHSHCIYEVKIYKDLSVFQKIERFFEGISHDSSIAFTFNQGNAPFIPLFVKALLRHLGRKPPIDAKYDPEIVQTWLSNNEPRRDLIACSSTLNNMKLEFVINLRQNRLCSNLPSISATSIATSHYTHICLPTPLTNDLKAMTFLSSDKNKQSDEAYSIYRDNFEKYLRRT